MPSFASQMTFDDAQRVVQEIARSSGDSQINRALYRGDHWLAGDGWIGPRPNSGDADYQEVFRKIQRAFVSQNVVREIVHRHKGALVGREPAYGLTSREYAKPGAMQAFRAGLRKAAQKVKALIVDENTAPTAESAPENEPNPFQDLIDEAESALDSWFDKRGAHSILAAAVATLLLEGRAPLRLFVPEGRLDANNRVPRAANLEAALDNLFFQHPESEQTALVIDPSTMSSIGIHVNQEAVPNSAWFNGSDGLAGASLALQVSTSGQTMNPAHAAPDAATGNATGGANSGGETIDTFPVRPVPMAGTQNMESPENGAHVAEVVYVEGTQTIFAQHRQNEVQAKGDEAQSTPYSLNLGGRLPIYEMRADPLVTSQIRQNQYQLNRTLTMMGHNIDLAGFVERVFLNVEDPNNKPDEVAENGQGEEDFRGRPRFRAGAGRTAYAVGVAYTSEDGTVKYATPDVKWRQPVDSKPLIDTIKRTYQNMLQEAQQMHVLISGDIAVSGEARRQAMADFVMALLITRPVVEAAVRWLIETLLAMGAAFMQDAGRFEQLRATCDVRLEAGPMMAEDMRMVMEAVAQRLMSRDTAMNRFNIDDIEAEKALILNDLKELQAAGFSLPTTGPAGVNGNPNGQSAAGQPNPQPMPQAESTPDNLT